MLIVRTFTKKLNEAPYGLKMDQSLGLLYYHRFDINAAVKDAKRVLTIMGMYLMLEKRAHSLYLYIYIYSNRFLYLAITFFLFFWFLCSGLYTCTFMKLY